MFVRRIFQVVVCVRVLRDHLSVFPVPDQEEVGEGGGVIMG